MSKYRIVDADCHILEPPDIWKNHLPKKYQDKAPQLVKDADGGDAWQFAGSPMPPRRRVSSGSAERPLSQLR